MSAKQLMLPANRVFDSDGAPEAGAKAFLYQTGTSTPAAFYEDVGLTVSLGSHITANAAGRFEPMPYQEATTPFRLVIENAEGTVLDDIDPFYFGQGVYNISGSVTAANRTILSLAVGIAGSAIILTEAGREGTFYWNASNLSASITSDPLQGVYVAPATDPIGASGAWVRGYNGSVNVKWFGAKADNVTDDFTSLQAALDYLKFTGGSLYLPAGDYKSTARLVVKTGIRIHGDGMPQDSRGLLGFMGTVITFNAGVGGIFVKYINDSDVVDAVATYPGGYATIIENLTLISAGNGAVSAGKYGLESRAKITLRNVKVRWFGDHGFNIQGSTSGSDGVVYGNVNGSYLENCESILNAGAGYRISGNDGNVITLNTCHSQSNTGWGYDDDSLIGVLYLGCINEGNVAGCAIVRRVGSPSSFIGCETEGGTLTLSPSCTVVGGNLGQDASGTAGGFTMSGGVAQNFPYRIINSLGTVDISAQLGHASQGMVALAFGKTAGPANWKFVHGPIGGTFSSDTWGLFYANSSSTVTMCFPDGDGRIGRNYAMEFPQGIVIGDQAAGAGLTNVIISGTAAPVAGTWVRGDIVLNHSPAVNGTWAWVCTTGGTPGTWTAMNVATGVNTGDQTITLTGDVTGTGTGSFATTIAANVVTFGKFQQLPTVSLVGNSTGGTANAQSITLAGGLAFSGTTLTAAGALTPTSVASTGAVTSSGTGGVGYATGAGGTVTQLTSRTTGVTLNKTCGAVTLFTTTTTAGLITTFTVTNSTVAATDTILVAQKSGLVTGPYVALVTAVAAGSFNVTIYTPNAVASDAPVFNFSVIKAVSA